MLLGTVRKETLTGKPIADLGNDQALTIRHTRTGWIVFIPRNQATRETCETLVKLGYIRPMGDGYVSTKQEVFFHQQTVERIKEKTRSPRASR